MEVIKVIKYLTKMLFNNTKHVIEQSSRRITSFCLTREKIYYFKGKQKYSLKKKGVFAFTLRQQQQQLNQVFLSLTRAKYIEHKSYERCRLTGT